MAYLAYLAYNDMFKKIMERKERLDKRKEIKRGVGWGEIKI
jgi:hypothetical protein